MNRPLRNRTTGGVGGRRESSRLLPDCAEHVRQLGGESPLHNLMEVK